MENKIIYIIIGVLLFVIIAGISIYYLRLTGQVAYTPVSLTIERNWCQDGDGKNFNLQSQVLYVNSKCKYTTDINNKDCGAMITVNDICYDSTYLLEQICVGNYLQTLKINCGYGGGCSAGKCKV